jgi:hypothetical protein
MFFSAFIKAVIAATKPSYSSSRPDRMWEITSKLSGGLPGVAISSERPLISSRYT